MRRRSRRSSAKRRPPRARSSSWAAWRASCSARAPPRWQSCAPTAARATPPCARRGGSRRRSTRPPPLGGRGRRSSRTNTPRCTTDRPASRRCPCAPRSCLRRRRRRRAAQKVATRSATFGDSTSCTRGCWCSAVGWRARSGSSSPRGGRRGRPHRRTASASTAPARASTRRRDVCLCVVLRRVVGCVHVSCSWRARSGLRAPGEPL
mmetsp:Transcript_42153/g.135546  ORF Transcript_42153/g.135546 Transcript_42153/m.135546 type:complete len:207 (+) Transcript_42153:447-1067(+)